VRAAEHITHSSRNGFGCGPLVKIVQESFPREIPADPWEFHLAFIPWRAAREHGGLPAEFIDSSTRRSEICRRLLAKNFAAAKDAERIDAACNYATRRSEFCRRLLAKNLAAAMDAVRIDSLCKWLHTTYADFSGEWFRESLELEFLPAFQPARDPSEEEGGHSATNPRRFSPAEQAIMDALREAGHRMTTGQILQALENRNNGIASEGTTKIYLAALVRRGALINRRDTDPPGYGLPEWG
jgi:hypothetical protein